MEIRLGPTALLRAALVGMIVCVVLTLLCGCGHLRGTVTTVIEANMMVSRRIDLVADQGIAQLLREQKSLGMDYMSLGDVDGANIRRYQGDDGYHVEITVMRAPAHEWCRKSRCEDVVRSYWWFVTYYWYVSRRDPYSLLTDADGAATEYAEPVVYVEDEVTMPGRIVTTNAGKVETSTATWSLGYRDLSGGHAMYAKSRRVNPLETSATVLLLAALVALTVQAIRRRR